MSQLLSRLFEKWLDAGGDLTYSEWLAERREIARRMRTPGGVIPVTQMQMQVLLQQQRAGLYQYRGFLNHVTGGLGGIFR